MKKKFTPTMNSWRAMKARCLNPNNNRYQHYGGRGITVCERWLTFKNFLLDMGERPVGLSLERIDNNKGYSKDNCKWATNSEQMLNRNYKRKIKIGDTELTAGGWERKLGLARDAIGQRIRDGMSPVDAVLTPFRKYERKEDA